MAFDGLVTNSLVGELKNTILNGRIGKIYQPERDEIYINIRNQRENYLLLMSANSNNPRFHLTEVEKENPLQPPMFCMILRKHLEGANILNIEQYKTDRILFIDVSSRDELGVESEKRLILEIMGRHSNLILIDKGSNKIIDSITRVTEDMSSVRQILPGLTYELPPIQDKMSPLNIESTSFLERLKNEDPKLPIFKFFYFNYMGLSPLISREFCHKAGIDFSDKIESLNKDKIERLFKIFKLEMENIKNNNINPTIIKSQDGIKLIDFHSLDIDQYSKNHIKEHYKSLSEALDSYYSKKDHSNRIDQIISSLKRSLQTKLDRSLNKLSKQRREFKISQDREIYKVYADLISANLYSIERGSENIIVENFYDESMALIEIPLDKKKSGPQNAQNYYKKYSRLKNANKLLKKQIPETEDEILYMENLVVSIENSTSLEDLDVIKEDLIKEGYLKGKIDKRKSKNLESSPHHYRSEEGYDIFVGKNNRQNDLLTFKHSTRDDLWLHVQKMPGSHVIIKNNGEEVSEETLETAALLGAYYSSGRGASQVPVDYTERKHVKKPKAAKPGLVIYDNFKTIFVDPDIKKINQIKKIK